MITSGFRDKASNFFKGFREKKLEEQLQNEERSKVLRGDPWEAARSGDHWAKEYTGLMREIWRMYQLQHSEQPITYEKGSVIHTARSLSDARMSDEIESAFDFSIDKPLFCHAVQLAHAPTQDQLERSEITVSTTTRTINTLKLSNGSIRGRSCYRFISNFESATFMFRPGFGAY